MENMMLEELKLNLIKSATWTNDSANDNDINRNHVNYGTAMAYSNVLVKFGVNVNVPVYGDGDFLRIPKLVIDTKIIYFENNKEGI